MSPTTCPPDDEMCADCDEPATVTWQESYGAPRERVCRACWEAREADADDEIPDESQRWAP